MNKKGDAWIGYILATGLFVAISVMTILWAKGYTEKTTSSAINYMEGREECKMVFVDANSDCSELKAENKGTIIIKKFIVRINRTAGYEEGGETESVKPQEILPIHLSIPETIKSVELLPIVEISKGQLASCTTKRLVVQCA